jgi:cob(I)alamin adenosyltransferase
VKIYTRTGDSGETSLFDGTRARKDDPRIDAYGEIDELNAWLGFVLASSRIDPGIDVEILAIQRDLFALGAQLADPGEKLAPRVEKAVIADAHVERLEQLIDRFETPVDPVLVRYVNRLSDLLFVLARTVNHQARAPETEW